MEENEIPMAGGEPPEYAWVNSPEAFAALAGCTLEEAQAIWDRDAVDGLLRLGPLTSGE